MIGNDVIDLALARKESNWRRSGFLDKIFTEKEQAIIGDSENPETTVWNLWSRKEAAYKIYNRSFGERGFFPLEIECDYETATAGSVNCKGESYFTKTEFDGDAIQTIAVTDRIDFDRILLLENRTGIKKLDGVPCFENPNRPVSISHHGRFTQIVALDHNPNLDLSLRNSKAIV